MFQPVIVRECKTNQLLTAESVHMRATQGNSLLSMLSGGHPMISHTCDGLQVASSVE